MLCRRHLYSFGFYLFSIHGLEKKYVEYNKIWIYHFYLVFMAVPVAILLFSIFLTLQHPKCLRIHAFIFIVQYNPYDT